MAARHQALWTEDEPFDFEGRFYNIKKGDLEPKPIQKPYPVVMYAGGSTKAAFRRAALRRQLRRLQLARGRGLRARVEPLRGLARNEFGRDLKVWCNAYVLQGDTEKTRAPLPPLREQEGRLGAVDNC